MLGRSAADPNLAAIRALLGGVAPKEVTLDRPKIKFPKVRQVTGGSLKPTKPSIAQRIESGTADALRAVGANNYDASRWAGKLFGAFNDLTPVGNVTGAQEGYGMLKQGITKGDLATGAAGLGSLLLSVLPFGGGAKKKPLQSLMKDESGAIRAWHGSPYDFDKFEWSPRTRGTGEGAQAYGDGLYFAEERKVADQYRTILSNRSKATDDPASAAGFWIGMHGGDRDAAIKTFESIKAQSQRILDRVAQRLPVAPGAAGHALSEISAADEALAHIARGTEGRAGGRLYEVSINAEPEDFLDYDAPLAKQPAALEALKDIDLSGTLGRTRKMLEWAREGAEQPHNLATGRELLNALSGYGEKRSGDLMALQPYGIKGVQFLDQGSRSVGQGTRNYVVFDDRLVNILGKH